MGENIRRSARIKAATKNVPKAVLTIHYAEGQGIFVPLENSFRLAVVKKDSKSSSQSIPVTWLEEQASLRYTLGASERVKPLEIAGSFSYKIQKGLYVISKAQHREILADINPPSDYDSEDSFDEKPVKRKRKKAGKATKGGKKRKIINIPIEDTRLLTDHSSDLIIEECLKSNNKNIHRAVITSNQGLFKKILKTKRLLTSVNSYWSPDCTYTPLMLAITTGQEFFIKSIYNELKRPKTILALETPSALGKVSTGFVSKATFGFNVRRVEMSRGGREGNNAFMYDENMNDFQNLTHQKVTELIKKGISVKTLKLLESILPDFDSLFMQNVGEAIRSGHLEMTRHLLNRFKDKNIGTNALHVEVLDSKPLSPFKSVSTIKKMSGNYCIAPLHVACINPDPSHLESVVDKCNDINFADMTGWKAVHFAAACTSAEPLKVLKQRGMNVNEFAKQKIYPIMVAAMYNRPATIVELAKDTINVNIKSREGMAAVHYAVANGCVEALKALLDNGADPNLPGAEGKTPLIYAAMKGETDCLQLLLDRGARPNKKDRRKRSPLIFAVKNSFAKETSLLLRHGALCSNPDSSKNFPMHYAAAYGSVQCLDLLIRAEADINCENDWKITPLLLAMLKVQPDCVGRLINQPDINVNCKNDSGRTLLSLSVEIMSDPAMFEKFRTLIVDKKADPNIPDNEGLTIVHHLCRKTVNGKKKNEWEALSLEALDLAVQAGANVNCPCEKGKTPAYYALENKNLKLFGKLVAIGADLTIKRLDGAGILHSISVVDSELFDVFLDILENKEVAQKCIHLQDENGLNPFLKFIEFFCSGIESAKQCIKNEVVKKMTAEIKNENPNAFVDKSTINAPPPKKANDSSSESDNNDMEIDDKYKLDDEDEEGDENFNFARDEEVQLQPQRSLFMNMGVNLFGRTQQNMELDDDEEEVYDGKKQRIPLSREEYETRWEIEYSALVGKFINLLKKMVSLGCDPLATVGKILKYRDDPTVIENEQKQFPLNKNGEYTTKLFIIDSAGNEKWKEYGENGLMNALHIIASNPIDELLSYLLSLGIPINAKDFYEFTPVARFVQASRFTSLEILMQKGADLKISNYLDQSPIHLSQLKRSCISALLAHGAEPNVLSKQNEIPLNTAIKSNNAEVVRLLLNGGADPNFLDRSQRTSLHIAFNNAVASADASFEIESMLLNHGADINATDVRNRTPLHYAFVKIGQHRDLSHIDPIEIVSSACSKSMIDVNVQDFWKKTPLHYAAQRDAVTSSMFMLSKGAELDLPDEEGNTPLAVALKYENINYAIMLIQKGANVLNNVYINDDSNRIIKKGVYTMFRIAVIQGWQGVAYLLLYHGYDQMRAIQDAMNEDKFQLVRTLLGKVSSNSVLQQKDENLQNLFHTLAIKCNSARVEHLRSICDQLEDSGVQMTLLDNRMRSPMHYAMEKQNKLLVDMFLRYNCPVDTKDINGDTPLGLLVKNQSIHSSKPIFKLVLKSKGTCVFRYKQDDIELTPLLNAFIQKTELKLIKYFIRKGYSLSETDSLGRNALMIAIINNDERMVSYLLSLEEININHADVQGRTAVHYCVQPLEYGSFENEKILKLLARAGANLNVKDKNKHSPMYYASFQKSGRMKTALQALGVKEKVNVENTLSVYTPEDIELDYRQDAEDYISSQQDVSKEIIIEKEPDKYAGSFPDSYKVFEDYDLYMVKVDISRGIYAAYLFYRMQILYDTNRDIYVLSTRWGRIGENGAYQRTPFNNKEEAEHEFQKIYKSKSGNIWGQMATRIPSKYRPIPLKEKTVEYNDFVKEFDIHNCPNSSLDKRTFKTFKEISDANIYRSSFTRMDCNFQIVNFSNISSELIEEAEKYLLELTHLNKELESHKSVEEAIEIKNKIYELSSRFYELIPSSAYQDRPVPPILGTANVETKLGQLDSLKNIAIASKMILGALKHQYSINPIDYLFKCIPANITILDQSDHEFSLIKEYIKNGEGNINELKNIYKVNRQGEAERISKYSEVTNRKLLWHGTSDANIVGILSRGLVIPPREAMNYGGMFGPGIYFANVYSKSRGFCNIGQSKHYFLFLCEVALGKVNEMKQVDQSLLVEKGCQSKLALGQRSPDPSKSIYFKNGIEVPIGPLVNRKLKNNTFAFVNLDEYIVFNSDQVRIRYLVHMENSYSNVGYGSSLFGNNQGGLFGNNQGGLFGNNQGGLFGNNQGGLFGNNQGRMFGSKSGFFG